jgi:SAM-dependent methyltransferase
MSTSLPQFESVYAGEPITEGVEHVPWILGEPQPAIAELIEAGQVNGRVLDAGCGVGDTTLHLAERGYEAVGVEASPSAVEQARRKATERKSPAEFHVADITTLSGFDGQFNTVIDSTLFHSMPVESRSSYLAAIARSAAPGAVLHILVFRREAVFPADVSPNGVDEQELRDAVGAHWRVDRVSEPTIAARTPEGFASGVGQDEQGRNLFPAYLLAAHLPE